MLRRLGPQFSPADGYVQQSDVAGYAVNGSTTRNLTHGMFRSVSLSAYADRYHGSDGATDQADSGTQLSTTFRNNVSFNAYLNASAARAVGGSYLPFDQNGAYLGYLTSTSTPSSIGYVGGAYGHGRLASWQRQLTFLVRRRLTVSFEADDDRYTPRTGTGDTPGVLWLERAGATVQLTRDASFSLGPAADHRRGTALGVRAVRAAPGLGGQHQRGVPRPARQQRALRRLRRREHALDHARADRPADPLPGRRQGQLAAGRPRRGPESLPAVCESHGRCPRTSARSSC